MFEDDNLILEKYGIDLLSDGARCEILDALLVDMASRYPNESWPQWLCDMIETRLAKSFDPGRCRTLEELNSSLAATRM